MTEIGSVISDPNVLQRVAEGVKPVAQRVILSPEHDLGDRASFMTIWKRLELPNTKTPLPDRGQIDVIKTDPNKVVDAMVLATALTQEGDEWEQQAIDMFHLYNLPNTEVADHIIAGFEAIAERGKGKYGKPVSPDARGYRPQSMLDQYAEGEKQIAELIDKNPRGFFNVAAALALMESPLQSAAMLLSGIKAHPIFASIQALEGRSPGSIVISAGKKLVERVIHKQGVISKMINFIDGASFIRKTASTILTNVEQGYGGISQENGPALLEALMRQDITFRLKYRVVSNFGERTESIGNLQEKEISLYGADILNLLEEDPKAYLAIFGQMRPDGWEEGEIPPPMYIMGKILAHKLELPEDSQIQIELTDIPQIWTDRFVEHKHNGSFITLEDWKKLPHQEQENYNLDVVTEKNGYLNGKGLQQYISYLMNLGRYSYVYLNRSRVMDPQILEGGWAYDIRKLFSLISYKRKFKIGPPEARNLSTLWQPPADRNLGAVPVLYRQTNPELMKTDASVVNGVLNNDMMEVAIHFAFAGPELGFAGGIFLEDIVNGTSPVKEKKPEAVEALDKIELADFMSLQGKLKYLHRNANLWYLRPLGEKWQVATGLLSRLTGFKNALAERDFSEEFDMLSDMGVIRDNDRYLIPHQIVSTQFKSKLKDQLELSEIIITRRENKTYYSVPFKGSTAFLVQAALGWESYDPRRAAENATLHKEGLYTLTALETANWLTSIGGAMIVTPKQKTHDRVGTRQAETYKKDIAGLIEGVAGIKGFGYGDDNLTLMLMRDLLDALATYDNDKLPNYRISEKRVGRFKTTLEIDRVRKDQIITTSENWKDARALGFRVDYGDVIVMGPVEVMRRGQGGSKEHYSGSNISSTQLSSILTHLLTNGKITKEGFLFLSERYQGKFTSKDDTP